MHVWFTNKSGILDLHVTDYTSNPVIEDNDRSLAYHPELRGRMILEATFWDENAAEALVQNLKEGEFVLLRNAQCDHKGGTLKVNIRSSVRGKKGTYDVGQSWKRLNITHPLVVEFLRLVQGVYSCSISVIESGIRRAAGRKTWSRKDPRQTDLLPTRLLLFPLRQNRIGAVSFEALPLDTAKPCTDRDLLHRDHECHDSYETHPAELLNDTGDSAEHVSAESVPAQSSCERHPERRQEG